MTLLSLLPWLINFIFLDLISWGINFEFVLAELVGVSGDPGPLLVVVEFISDLWVPINLVTNSNPVLTPVGPMLAIEDSSTYYELRLPVINRVIFGGQLLFLDLTPASLVLVAGKYEGAIVFSFSLLYYWTVSLGKYSTTSYTYVGQREVGIFRSLA